MANNLLNNVVDLSHNNATFTPEVVAAAGIAAVILKATQGLDFVDPTFRERDPLVRRHGMMCGGYHFATGDDAAAQAQHFLGVVPNDGRTLMALDLEDNGDNSMSLAGAQHFVQHIHDATGHWPVLYSGNRIKQLLLGTDEPDPILKNCPLWLPQYGPAAQVPHPTWATWTLWQYTETGFVDGIGVCDRSYFNGNLNQLRSLFGYGPI